MRHRPFPTISKTVRERRILQINGRVEDYNASLFWLAIAGLNYLPVTVRPICVRNDLPIGVQVIGPVSRGFDDASLRGASGRHLSSPRLPARAKRAGTGFDPCELRADFVRRGAGVVVPRPIVSRRNITESRMSSAVALSTIYREDAPASAFDYKRATRAILPRIAAHDGREATACGASATTPRTRFVNRACLE